MRCALFVFLLLSLLALAGCGGTSSSSESPGTLTFSQSNSVSYSGTGDSFSCTYASNVTQGNLLVVFGSVNPSGPFTMSVSDTLGNTWKLVTTEVVPGSSFNTGMWYAIANASGPTTVTLSTGAGQGDYEFLAVAEYAVTGSAPIQDGYGGGSATIGGTYTTTTGGSSGSADLVVGGWSCGGYPGNSGSVSSLSSGYTIRESQVNNDMVFFDKTASSSAAQSATATTNAASAAILATFRPGVI